MSSTDVKSKLGKEDLNAWGGNATRTFTRRTSDGGTITLHKINNFVDILQVYGDGTTPTHATLTDAIVGIEGQECCFDLAPGTWPVTANLTIPSNVTMRLRRGAAFSVSASVTLTISGSFDAGLYQVFSGAGSVVLGVVKNVYPQWWGATGDGVTDDTAAIQAAATTAAGTTLVFPEPSVSYKVAGTITLSSNTTVTGIGRPLIVTTSMTLPIFQGQAVSNVTIMGLRLQGGGSGGAAGNKGLIDINSAITTLSQNIRILDNELWDFRNGITATYCQNLWIERNIVHDFLLYGILGSLSYNFHIDRNNVYSCDQTGAVNAYGIMATGDYAGGKATQRSSISFNQIDGIPSWDGIMSHDVSGLHIIGNDIRDVRTGIDIGHFEATNIVTGILIALNYIKSTTTDTWSGAGAMHGGIVAIGYNASNRVSNVTITGNIIEGFYAVTGLVPSGDYSNIAVSNCDQAAITGNIVTGVGSTANAAGVYVAATCNNPTVTGNILQGSMGSGGVRFANVIADTATISGNTIDQSTPTDTGIYITGSTIGGLALGENATNVNAGYEYSVSTSTIGIRGSFRSGSATYDPGNLADGAGISVEITCTGAALGDFAEASFSLDVQGITMTAAVKSANTVTVHFQNETGGAIDLGEGILRVRTRPYGF